MNIIFAPTFDKVLDKQLNTCEKLIHKCKIKVFNRQNQN
jgi:hypothetical protein